MKGSRLALLATSIVLAACAAGGSTAGDTAAGQDLIRPVERVIVGRAQPYPADTGLRARAGDLAKSKRARRAVGWEAVGRALAKVDLAEAGVKITGGETQLPRFRTWYDRDDVVRIFAKAYAGLGKDGRKARAPIVGAAVDAVFDANAKDKGSWSADDYLARLKEVTDAESVQGLAGNSRVGYSPGVVRHLLGQYGALLDCLPKVGELDPLDATSFAPCFREEMPVDAALVKASWWRADFGMTLPVHETTAAALTARRAETKDDGGWGKGEREADPDPQHVYTVKTTDGNVSRLAGLHLATKELREWLWVTIWWSPTPDEDFGADRPDAIKKLGPPWDQYKMCVVSSYEENDSDPRGGFDGSLGDALAATHEPDGGPSWCSNPYVERGAHNGRTNCIGCHQHAGNPGLTSEIVLREGARFPRQGRTRVRKNFPFDYVFQIDARPDSLVRIAEAQLKSWEPVDR